MEPLNSKDVKRLLGVLHDQYGYAGTPDVVFLLNEKRMKVFAVSRELAALDLARTRVDTLGCYVGAWVHEQFRLTIEGTQLFGPGCTKNVVEITHQELQRWLSGENLTVASLATPPHAERGAFVILRCGDEYLGCGKLTETAILNYIPKARYVHALYDE